MLENIIGKPISVDLSTHLRNYIGTDDRASISEVANVHINTVNNIVYRKTNMTKDNLKVLIELIKAATNNCDIKINQSKKSKKELEKYLVHE